MIERAAGKRRGSLLFTKVHEKRYSNPDSKFTFVSCELRAPNDDNYDCNCPQIALDDPPLPGKEARRPSFRDV